GEVLAVAAFGTVQCAFEIAELEFLRLHPVDVGIAHLPQQFVGCGANMVTRDPQRTPPAGFVEPSKVAPVIEDGFAQDRRRGLRVGEAGAHAQGTGSGHEGQNGAAQRQAARLPSCAHRPHSAALARTVRGVLDHRRTFVVLAFADIAVDAAVIVVVGPNRPGETADNAADQRPFEHRNAACQRTDARAGRSAKARALRGGAQRRGAARAGRGLLPSGWLALVVLALADIAVGVAVAVVV